MAYGFGFSNSWSSSIHNAFNSAASNLDSQKWKMFRDIETWRGDFIRQIDEHLRRQKAVLEQEYHTKKQEIDSVRRQYIDLAQQYEFNREEKLINELIADCNKMQFELGTFEYIGPAIPFIQFMTQAQLKQKKHDDAKSERTTDNTFRNNPDRDYDNNSTTNTAGANNSAFIRQSSTVPHQPK